MSNQYRELAKADKQLVAFAQGVEGLLPEQQAYISYMGRQLQSYNVGFANNVLLYQLIAVIVLSANYISVGVTGTPYLPCGDAKSLSFVINLFAALLSGVAQLFLFDKAAAQSQIAGARLRWEFWQFIGSSEEYMGLDLEARYNEFTRQTDDLIGDDLAAQHQLISKTAKAKETEDEKANRIQRAEDGKKS